MIYFQEDCFKEESLIEICTFPQIQINKLFLEMAKQKKKVFFMDTIGNIDLLIKHQNRNKEYECFRIFSISDFYDVCSILQSETGFYLFIDSITFVIEWNKYSIKPGEENHPKKIYNKLWDLIYSNNATIIVTNHYRPKLENGNKVYVPRLGNCFFRIISYRVLLKNNDNEIEYKVIVNDLNG
ncbi:hypothetical protein CWI38_1150p0030 [Hamiltosporidium tvaerminnensis]|uniref:DNA recombination and repair protein Rad51-like C-terminal domain-containing protein n=1 Tax=Hamiltosporidium tvaerminnensis TaxID=1176355 RepID=A0A4V2JXE8_9MICR|nr:hypothetical protein CWI38_1540p0010 [Hamiltosporidium tvaerminnensis]TBU11542.1 hypothetical protein CWI38_1150p0030 [Hamiltosporidium tvaerminnensis]